MRLLEMTVTSGSKWKNCEIRPQFSPQLISEQFNSHWFQVFDFPNAK